MTAFPKLFSPMQVGTLTLKNRLVLTAHEPRVPLKRFYRYLEERAKGGVALIICSNPSVYGILPYTVGPPTRLPPGYLGGSDVLLPNPAKPDGVTFYDGWLTPLLREETELIHRHGAACFGQLVHTGNYDIFDNWQAGIGPSTVADEMLGNIPHQLDEEEIQEVIFVHAQQARRVKEAGMDGVEVHACHGLLLNSFLSPITNKRTDKYGGSLETRMRFVVEVIEAVRKAVGPDFPVGLRMPGNELVEGGLSLQDMVDIARRIAPKADIAAVQQLMAQGIESEEEIARRLKPLVDYFNISGASESGRKAGVTVPTVSPMDTPHGVFTPFTTAIRKAVGVPVLVSARIVDPAQAERILASGQADLIGVVRAFIADPEFGTKAQEGRADEIRKCTGAGEGCRKRTIQRVGGAAPISCTVNAAVAREEEMEIIPTKTPKKVLVVGGGPGGMEAARVATLRGHKVILCEKGEQLGGQVRVLIRDPRSEELGESIRYLTKMMTKLNVDVRLKTTVTAESAERLAPDAVIVATGATPLVPDVPGVNQAHVVTANQVLMDEVTVGKRVCVVAGLDGHHMPPSLAELLVDKGHAVELITERMLVGENQDPGFHHVLLKRLVEKGVGMSTLTGLKAIKGRSVVVFHSLTRAERTLGDFDTVVLAAGGKADNALHRALKGRVKEIYVVGDALAPRRILHAVLEGARAGLTVP